MAYLRLWHYFQDGRSYRGNRIALSATGEFAGEERVVYDSEVQGEYGEREEGKLLAFPPLAARYIGNWLTDNSSNRAVQWVEIEAYGPLGQEPIPKPPGTGSFCGVLGAKCACPLRPQGFGIGSKKNDPKRDY